MFVGSRLLSFATLSSLALLSVHIDQAASRVSSSRLSLPIEYGQDKKEDLAWRRKRRLEDFLAEERERLQNFLFEEGPTSDEYGRGNKAREVKREQEGGGRTAKVFEKEA